MRVDGELRGESLPESFVNPRGLLFSFDQALSFEKTPMLWSNENDES